MRTRVLVGFMAACVWLATAALAFADATPVSLVLVYLPNVSNTGTPSASGIAELVMPEGEVRISATELPRLDGDKSYVAWVVNTETNQFYRLGAFNSARSGTIRFENVLPDAIPNKHWNLLLVTVETSAEAAEPSKTHSIAGVFPRADSEPLPGVLPNTGGIDPSTITARVDGPGQADWLRRSGPVALVALMAGGAGYLLGNRRAARSAARRLVTTNDR
jgi:hypothetical protein